MNKQDYVSLFSRMFPDFFVREDIRSLPDELIFDEMILPLNDLKPTEYEKELDECISFGYYYGDLGELKETVEKVQQYWTQFFDGKNRVYCGYIDGKVASFCLIEDNGEIDINGCKVKIGGPGCVGTLPECRNNGIGLTMVKNVTQILKDEGYDYSYIHFTGVAPWYEKLGYKTSIKWNKNGIM